MKTMRLSGEKIHRVWCPKPEAELVDVYANTRTDVFNRCETDETVRYGNKDHLDEDTIILEYLCERETLAHNLTEVDLAVIERLIMNFRW